MTAVEVAVKALIDLTNDKDAPASVRCEAAATLLVRDYEGGLIFASYDEQGQFQKAAA